MNNEPKACSLTIASGATESNVLRTTDFCLSTQNSLGTNRHFCPKGILLPVTTGTSFSFMVSDDGINFYQLRDRLNAPITVTKTAAEASAHYLSAQIFAGFNFFKIVSNLAEAAPRTILMTGYPVE